MYVVKLFVRADCVHVGVDSETWFEPHFAYLEALPFCKRMYDFHVLFAHVLYREFYGTLNPVQVIVDSCA